VKIIQTFLLETDFFYEQIRHKLSFIYKNSKVCTQLRIFQKEIKSRIPHSSRADAYMRRKRLISKSERLDAPKSILETEKNLKLPLLSKYIKKKTHKTQKNQKKPKKPTGLGLKKKTGFVPTLQAWYTHNSA
jgi:hypothetical protein